MKDEKHINAWLHEFGYKWVEGQERIYKATFTWVEASQIISILEAEGAVERG